MGDGDDYIMMHDPRHEYNASRKPASMGPKIKQARARSAAACSALQSLRLPEHDHQLIWRSVFDDALLTKAGLDYEPLPQYKVSVWDLQTFAPDVWLPDTVINTYFDELAKAHPQYLFFNSHLYQKLVTDNNGAYNS